MRGSCSSLSLCGGQGLVRVHCYTAQRGQNRLTTAITAATKYSQIDISHLHSLHTSRVVDFHPVYYHSCTAHTASLTTATRRFRLFLGRI